MLSGLRLRTLKENQWVSVWVLLFDGVETPD